MNKNRLTALITLSLFSLLVVVFSIIGASVIVYQRNRLAQSPAINGEASQSGQFTKGSVALTVSEIARHNTSSDCWMIISGNVYNLTSFLVSHPGGSLVMTPYCGKDGTIGFQTKDKKPASKHSKSAESMLPQFLIGKFGDTIGAKTSISTESGLSNSTLTKTDTNNSEKTNVTNAVGVNQSVISLSQNEIASHNTSSNCWIIISNTVYNVTNYLTSHPGGVGVITPYCGKDATNAFATKGGQGNNHSRYAHNLLDNYRIGMLGSTVNQNSQSDSITISQPNIPTEKATPQPTSTSQSFSTSEAASHNTSSNCWIVISNTVYNVTNYLTSHPGGVGVITPYCGKDATNAFSTKGGQGNNHSSYAYTLLSNYRVGSLSVTGGSVSTQPNTPLPTSSQNTTSLPASVLTKYPGATIKSQQIEDNNSQELEIYINGICRHIKVNSSGSITEDEKC